VQPKDLLEGSTDELPQLLAWDVLAHRGRRIKGLDIIVRSMASREAGPIVRDFISREAVGPLAEKLGGATACETSHRPPESTSPTCTAALALRGVSSQMRSAPRTTEAAVIVAVITGVAILRNVIGLAPLGEAEGGYLERLLAHVIRETAKGAEAASPRRRLPRE
jgi:hypothetical protein